MVIKRNHYNYLNTMDESLPIINVAIELYVETYEYNKRNNLGAMIKGLDIAALGGTFDGTNICVKEGLIMAFYPDGTPYGFMSKYGRWPIIHSHMVNTPAWKYFKNCVDAKYRLTKIRIGQGTWNYSNSSIPLDTYTVGYVGECQLDRLPSLVYNDPRQESARAVIKEFRESYPANQDEDLVRPPSDWVWTRPEAKRTPAQSNVSKKTRLNPFERLTRAERRLARAERRCHEISSGDRKAKVYNVDTGYFEPCIDNSCRPDRTILTARAERAAASTSLREHLSDEPIQALQEVDVAPILALLIEREASDIAVRHQEAAALLLPALVRGVVRVLDGADRARRRCGSDESRAGRHDDVGGGRGGPSSNFLYINSPARQLKSIFGAWKAVVGLQPWQRSEEARAAAAERAKTRDYINSL